MSAGTAAAAIDADAFNAFEAEGWSRRAAGYDEFFAPITGRVTEPLLDAADVGPGTAVLDVATGPGYVAGAALAREAEVTGIDVAAEMVDLAARRNPAGSFVRGDAERLPFADGSFDAAVAGFAILHIGRPERAARELARVLRPGGRVAATVWDLPERSRLMGLFVDAVAEAGAPPPTGVPAGPDFFRFAEDAELSRLLAGAGFEEPRVEALEFVQPFGDADELWHGMLGGTVRMRAMVAGQAPADRRRIREAFDRLLADHSAAGRIEVPVRVKLGAARLPG